LAKKSMPSMAKIDFKKHSYIQKNTVQKRIGFLKGKIEVPDDFDSMGQKEIIEMFLGSSSQSRGRSVA